MTSAPSRLAPPASSYKGRTRENTSTNYFHNSLEMLVSSVFFINLVALSSLIARKISIEIHPKHYYCVLHWNCTESALKVLWNDRDKLWKCWKVKRREPKFSEQENDSMARIKSCIIQLSSYWIINSGYLSEPLEFVSMDRISHSKRSRAVSFWEIKKNSAAASRWNSNDFHMSANL